MNTSNIQASQNDRILLVGDIVKHFKFETLSNHDKFNKRYLYKIIGFGKHTETNEHMVIYESLYDYQIWIRPLELFMSTVDNEKYPNINQKYIFEKI